MTGAPASTGAPLSTVFTIPQVAKMAGWTAQRMRRHLETMNEHLEGRLLRNVSRGNKRPRWTITLSALQAVAPQWFHDPENVDRRLGELEEENEQLRGRVFRLEKIVELHTSKLQSNKVASLRAAG